MSNSIINWDWDLLSSALKNYLLLFMTHLSQAPTRCSFFCQKLIFGTQCLIYIFKNAWSSYQIFPRKCQKHVYFMTSSTTYFDCHPNYSDPQSLMVLLAITIEICTVQKSKWVLPFENECCCWCNPTFALMVVDTAAQNDWRQHHSSLLTL